MTIPFCAFISGLVFGIGLIVSQMVNPAKVLGFLDIAGRWDPSLALVMVGAIAVGFFAFKAACSRSSTVLGSPFHFPPTAQVDRRLLGGSLLFGIGWGLAGFCPGPAVVALGAGQAKALVFVPAMLGGMLLFELLERMRGPSEKAATAESAATSK